MQTEHDLNGHSWALSDVRIAKTTPAVPSVELRARAQIGWRGRDNHCAHDAKRRQQSSRARARLLYCQTRKADELLGSASLRVLQHTRARFIINIYSTGAHVARCWGAHVAATAADQRCGESLALQRRRARTRAYKLAPARVHKDMDNQFMAVSCFKQLVCCCCCSGCRRMCAFRSLDRH